ncbi:SRPBCC family protein [Myxococcota bacterium]|nr:SRPBCC family protein [Myxococcota bacterium]
MIPPLLALLTALLTPAAHAEPVPDDHNADVVATFTVGGSPSAVTEVVSDLKAQEALLTGCTQKWEHGSVSVGVGANAQLVYKVGPWRRKLTGTITQVDPGRRVTVDHAGNKGFITTWTVSAADAGAQVELRTLLNLPPKPFRKIYVNRIQARWQACYAEALVKLDNSLPR